MNRVLPAKKSTSSRNMLEIFLGCIALLFAGVLFGIGSTGTNPAWPMLLLGSVAFLVFGTIFVLAAEDRGSGANWLRAMSTSVLVLVAIEAILYV